MALTLPTILALLASPAVWDVTSLNPPVICQVAPDPLCIVRSAHEVLVSHGAKVEAIPEPGGLIVWREANLRVADAALLRRDRAERARIGAEKVPRL